MCVDGDRNTGSERLVAERVLQRDRERRDDEGEELLALLADSPLVLRDIGNQEIYALDWEAP